MKKKLITYSLLSFCLACSVGGSRKAQSNPHIEVRHSGELRNMMHRGDLSAKADLENFKHEKHFYALGAVENLKGEILVLDSKAFIPRLSDSSLKISHDFDVSASLLVYASVPSWVSQPLPAGLESSHLEDFIKEAAHNKGIDTTQAFPFLLDGRVKALRWHVVNWPEGDTLHTHRKHIESGLQGVLHKREVRILGFWSNKHKGIFTHHSSVVHMHFVTADEKIAGHVDKLVTSGEMILKLPLQEDK